MMTNPSVFDGVVQWQAGAGSSVDELAVSVAEVQNPPRNGLGAVDSLGGPRVDGAGDGVLLVDDAPAHRDDIDDVGDGQSATTRRVLDHDVAVIYRITNRHT